MFAIALAAIYSFIGYIVGPVRPYVIVGVLMAAITLLLGLLQRAVLMPRQKADLDRLSQHPANV